MENTSTTKHFVITNCHMCPFAEIMSDSEYMSCIYKYDEKEGYPVIKNSNKIQTWCQLENFKN